MQSQVCAFHGGNVAWLVCSHEWGEKDGASCMPVVEIAGPLPLLTPWLNCLCSHGPADTLKVHLPKTSASSLSSQESREQRRKTALPLCVHFASVAFTSGQAIA